MPTPNLQRCATLSGGKPERGGGSVRLASASSSVATSAHTAGLHLQPKISGDTEIARTLVSRDRDFWLSFLASRDEFVTLPASSHLDLTHHLRT